MNTINDIIFHVGNVQLWGLASSGYASVSQAEWDELSMLADAAGDIGDYELEDCLRYMGTHQKRPYLKSTGIYSWVLCESPNPATLSALYSRVISRLGIALEDYLPSHQRSGELHFTNLETCIRSLAPWARGELPSFAQTVPFSSLAIGDCFRFETSSLVARKTSIRKYQYRHNGMICQVGTLSVRVIKE